MSNRQPFTDQVLTIHPRALKALGLEAATVMLGVARDLRSGAIKPELYNQGNWISDHSCGTACCIAGHTAIRLGRHADWRSIEAWASNVEWEDDAIWKLFSPDYPSDPLLAADAIERYIYDGADRPWDAGGA